MPRMDREIRSALMVQVAEMRDDQQMTFQAIADELRLPSRQIARLLYRAEMQRRIDEQALTNVSINGIDVWPHFDLSPRVLARIRRENPDALVAYDRRREVRRNRDDEQVESAGQVGTDGSAFERLIGDEQ